MNPMVINAAHMDALVEVLLKFYGEDMNSWPHRNFVFYNQTNKQYDTNVLKKPKYEAARSSRRKQQVHC